MHATDITLSKSKKKKKLLSGWQSLQQHWQIYFVNICDEYMSFNF